MAYCPHVRNSGHFTQSVEDLLEQPGCGTIEKPIWMKYAGACVNAQSFSKPSRRARRRSSSTIIVPTPLPRVAAVDRERADLRNLRARAAPAPRSRRFAARARDDEPRGVDGQLAERPRQQMAFVEVRRDQGMQLRASDASPGAA